MSARDDIVHQRQVAVASGAVVEFDHTKRHRRATFKCGDRTRAVVFSGTRTDYRGNRNTISTARRVLREIVR
jgi:hypothetical protein